MRFLMAGLVGVFLGALGAENAHSITYNEAVDGDLTTSTIINLSIGMNTVIGDSSRTQSTGIDSDGFNFFFDNGLQLDSVKITITNLQYLGALLGYYGQVVSDGIFAQYTMRNVNQELTLWVDGCPSYGCSLIVDGVAIPTPAEFDFTKRFPLRFGEYVFGQSYYSAYFSASYQIDFKLSEASEVPEPATGIFLISAIGSLGVMHVYRNRNVIGL